MILFQIRNPDLSLFITQHNDRYSREFVSDQPFAIEFTNHRFLPYTVEFEVVDPEHKLTIDDQPESKNSEESNLEPNIDGSIILSLSLAKLRQGTPTSDNESFRKALTSNEESGNESTESFFYRNSNHSNSRLNQSDPNRFIQPKSRFSNLKLSSSVVGRKKDDDDPGLTAVKMNRSSSMVNSQLQSGFLGERRDGGGSGGKSQLSLSVDAKFNITDDHDDSYDSDLSLQEGDWNYFNNSIHGRTRSKVAPYGGFSNPDLEGGVFNTENVFENAPWKVVMTKKGNPSLIKAVRFAYDTGVIKNRRWVGTLALPHDSLPQKVIKDIDAVIKKDYVSEPIFADDLTFLGFYNLYCKQILWPIMHYQLPEDPKSKQFTDQSWSQYKQVNQMIADKIVEVYKKENSNLDPNDPENIVWVHDYHLLLVPKMVRDQLPNAQIGLFLHVSFPSSELFRCLPNREELLSGMLGADCISFQNDEYVRHFGQTCQNILGADLKDRVVHYNGRHTSTNTICMGINSRTQSETIRSDSVKEWADLVRLKWSDKTLLVSRDKLDKLRGVKQKLLAYERLLKENPLYINECTLIQICAGSADDEYEAQIMQLTSRINNLSDNLSDSPPVILLQRNIEYEQYLGLLCEADCFIVSSMREGLNLTSHDFIIATEEKHSPLIMSEFTGSSSLFGCNGKGAILINPWDIKTFADMFKKALTLTKEEKDIRWENCLHIVKTHDAINWITSCLRSVNESWKRDSA